VEEIEKVEVDVLFTAGMELAEGYGYPGNLKLEELEGLALPVRGATLEEIEKVDEVELA